MLDSLAPAAFGTGHRERLLQLTFVAICSHSVLLTPCLKSFLCESGASLILGALVDDDSQDFSTFSFDSNATPAMAYQACDPLDQQGVFEAYSQDSQESCVSAPGMYNLTIDTSFINSCTWTASSSPLSSMPGTPQTYSAVHTPCDPSSILDNYLSSDSHGYDPSAEFLPQHQQQHGTQLYPSGVPAFCAPTGIDIAYGTQEFGGVPPKGDFASFYGRPALEPVDAAAFAPTYLSSAPTFAI